MAGLPAGTMFSQRRGRSSDASSRAGVSRSSHLEVFVVARRLEPFAAAMATTVLSVPLLGTLTTHSIHSIHSSSIVASLLGSLGVCANVNVAACVGAALVAVVNVTAVL